MNRSGTADMALWGHRLIVYNVASETSIVFFRKLKKHPSKMRYLLFLSLFLCFSCTPSETEQLLMQSWKYDMNATLQELEEQGAGASDLNYMRSIMIGLQDASITFMEKGKVRFEMPDLEVEGTWKLQNKETELMLILEEASPQISNITYLVTDTLILAPKDGDNSNQLRVLTLKMDEL